MKALRTSIVLLACTALMASCSVFGSNKRGCPAGGVGAEKMMDGSKTPKQKKFRA